MVWTATTLAYEIVASNWERLKHEKRPLVQCEIVFDQMRALVGSRQNL